MATKTFCDRCGKEAEIQQWELMPLPRESIEISNRRDFCHHCSQVIQESFAMEELLLND